MPSAATVACAAGGGATAGGTADGLVGVVGVVGAVGVTGPVCASVVAVGVDPSEATERSAVVRSAAARA
jgi:hypothetical protein